MRIAFFGSGTFALAALRALQRSGLAPVLVVTRPARRRSRGKGAEVTPVAAWAAEAGIEVFAPESVNAPASLERLRAAGAALFAVAEYGQILSQGLLDIPAHGAVNVHGSLLPRWRGASPVHAAILEGDAETGVTIQRVVRRLDAGPILAQRREPILPEDDAGTLGARLAETGGEALVEVVGAIAAGAPPPEVPQREEDATFCRRLTREDEEVDWSQPAARVVRQVRALTPRPGARTALLRAEPVGLIVRRCRAAEGAGEPGVVLGGTRGLVVAAGEGAVEIEELTPAGRKTMDGAAFRNGFSVEPGEALGQRRS